MFNRLNIYTFFLLFIAASFLKADQFKITNYKVIDVPGGISVYSGIQDKMGFLWFSTAEGLFKFDGQKFMQMAVPNHEKKAVKNIFQDKNGTYWISLKDDVCKFDGANYKLLKINQTLKTPFFRKIVQTNDGAIWIQEGRYLGRILKDKFEDFSDVVLMKNDRKDYFLDMNKDPQGQLLIKTRRAFKKFDGTGFAEIQFPGIPDDISTFKIENDGKIVFGTLTGKIGIYTNRKCRLISHSDFKYIYNISKDEKGTYWISTSQGIFVLDGDNLSQVNTSKDPNSSNVWYTFEDNENNIWACTATGICKIQRNSYSKISMSNFKSDLKIMSIQDDENGKLWMVTAKNGLMTFEKGRFSKVQMGDHDCFRRIKDILIRTSDDIWYNTDCGLFNLKNNRLISYEKIDTVSTKVSSSLRFDNKGRLYFMDSKKNLRIFDGNTLISPLLKTPEPIFNVIKDHKGEILLKSLKAIYRMDGSLIFKFGQDGVVSDALSTVFDNEGDIWISTLQSGIKFYNVKQKKLYLITKDQGLLDYRIKRFFLDKDGFLWISTRSGISRFDTRTFKKTGKAVFENFRNPEEEISRTAYGFCQDKAGNIWAGTSHGLLKFEYQVENKEIKIIPPPVYITGMKLFLDKFDYLQYADSLDKNSHLPVKMKLPYNKNYITFNFVGLDYTDPEIIDYQYRLSGFDANWSPILRYDEQTYTNLPPGKYTFEVKARNKDGQWSVKPASISFEILPPFWKTWWFYSLSFITLLSMVGAYINIKTRSLKKQKLILEKTVEERTMELKLEKMKVEAINQDLEKSRYQLAKINELQEKWLRELSESEQELLESNESKDKLFSLISHDLRSPFRSLLVYSEGMMKRLDEMTPEEIKSYLNNVHKSAENIYGLVEDLLEWSRVHTGRMECNPVIFDVSVTVNEIVNVLSASAEKKKIAILNNVEENSLVNADKGMIKSVINNLISNAIKFTYSGGQIMISAQATEEMMEISVKDDGVGLSPENMEKLFKVGTHFHTDGTAKEKGTGLGLILCKELIEKNNGEISVISRQGDGSTFVVTLPRN